MMGGWAKVYDTGRVKKITERHTLCSNYRIQTVISYGLAIVPAWL